MKKTEIKASKFATQKQLEECGWKFFTERGIYKIFRQALEELYWCSDTNLILGVYQIS